METKVTRNCMEDLAQKLGFNRIKCAGARGLAGGSCLMWNNSIDMVVNYFAEGFFEATVWDNHTQLNWKLYAVYGTPYIGAKETFWESLETEISLCHMPWVLIGDLNCISNQEEKSGGRRVTANDTKWLSNFMEASGGVDLQFIGNKYTWQNNRFSGGLIRERLDRAIVSSDWLMEYASAGVRNMPISISDHAPIILDTHLFASRGFIPFRFFEAWSWEESCKQEVALAWSSSGNDTVSFIRNIDKSRRAIQVWKKNHTSLNEGEIKHLECRLQWIQNQPISDLLKEEEARIHALISDSWLKLESMWRQKSRETWLSLGDKNTRFFHAATVIRKRRNSIWSIKDKGGRVWKDKKHIAEIINQHFQELFSSSNPLINGDFDDLFNTRIDSQSNECFAASPSEAEIREAVFSLHPLKVPGPDGFSGVFYRRYWDLVGPSLCITVKEFFSTGYMHPKLNTTFICLIPKVEFPLSVDQFRPISLCNFSYKVIAKILSNRLRPLMNSLVSPFQSAFIPGRWIAESSILTQELVHKIRQKRGVGGLMALKLDMHKAYDKMEWSFLDKVLCANGFNDRCRKLLMACVTSVSYSVLLNGSPLKKISPQRGLRQGDPISPFLFLLCQEVLSKIICKAEERGAIHGIKIAHSAPPVSHLMFADDTILFARANEKEAKKLMECISLYENWSGQSCSKPKSSVLFSRNLSSQRKEQILGNLNIDQVRGDERHLGNPFVFKRRKKEDYFRLKESLMKKLEGWKMKLLSYAGRLTLIKSVTSAIPIYAMSTSRIPLSSCRELDALMRKFWWLGKVDKNRYLALKAWDQICQPKISGGLGIRRCEDMNKALVAKLAWNLASHEDRPWVNCLLKKYCNHESFWSVKKKSNDSFQWICILDSRDTILKGTITVAASGRSISFWHQPWIPWMEYHEFASLMNSLRGRGYTIKTLEDVSIENKWNEELIEQVFGHELGTRISNIPRIPSPFSDQVFWKSNQVGIFSVKEAYRVDNASRFGIGKNLWKWIWGNGVHPRVSVMLWRVLNEAIPTKNRLPFLNDKFCNLCDTEVESAFHLFWQCSFSRAIWFGGIFSIRTECFSDDNLINLFEKVLDLQGAAHRFELLNYVGCVFTEIWHQRNALCIRNAAANTTVALHKIGTRFFELQNISNNLGRTELSMTISVPLNTAARSFSTDYRYSSNVAFSDASWTRENAGIAAVCLDIHNGRWSIQSQKIKALSALEAEFQAISLALSRAAELGWQEVHLLSDSSIAIKALSSSGGCPDWKFANVFYSIINLSRKFLNCHFFYINRSLNVVADGAAKNARIASESAFLYQGEGNPPVIPIYFP
ncbi:hypothetical protein CsatA_027590 [Cannabis sativa]